MYIFVVLAVSVLAVTWYSVGPGLDVIKKICSTQLSMKLILLLNIKMPTIFWHFNIMSRINTSYESLKARNTYLFQYFSFYEQLKFDAQLSLA